MRPQSPYSLGFLQYGYSGRLQTCGGYFGSVIGGQPLLGVVSGSWELSQRQPLAFMDLAEFSEPAEQHRYKRLRYGLRRRPLAGVRGW